MLNASAINGAALNSSVSRGSSVIVELGLTVEPDAGFVYFVDAQGDVGIEISADGEIIYGGEVRVYLAVYPQFAPIVFSIVSALVETGLSIIADPVARTYVEVNIGLDIYAFAGEVKAEAEVQLGLEVLSESFHIVRAEAHIFSGLDIVEDNLVCACNVHINTGIVTIAPATKVQAGAADIDIGMFAELVTGLMLFAETAIDIGLSFEPKAHIILLPEIACYVGSYTIAFPDREAFATSKLNLGIEIAGYPSLIYHAITRDIACGLTVDSFPTIIFDTILTIDTGLELEIESLLAMQAEILCELFLKVFALSARLYFAVTDVNIGVEIFVGQIFISPEAPIEECRRMYVPFEDRNIVLNEEDRIIQIAC